MIPAGLVLVFVIIMTMSTASCIAVVSSLLPMSWLRRSTSTSSFIYSNTRSNLQSFIKSHISPEKYSEEVMMIPIMMIHQRRRQCNRQGHQLHQSNSRSYGSNCYDAFVSYQKDNTRSFITSSSIYSNRRLCSSSLTSRLLTSSSTSTEMHEQEQEAKANEKNDDSLSTSSEPNNNNIKLSMENIYDQWSIEEDEYLLKHFTTNSLSQLAAYLGRGLGGVEARIKKLNDVSSLAYERLFVKNVSDDGDMNDDNHQSSSTAIDEDSFSNTKSTKGSNSNKLTPAMEVLRRIKWDYMLNEKDFTVQYYDRVQDNILSCSFDAPNENVSSKAEEFVFAIPEHRISSIKYKERIVWDKSNKLDLVFGTSKNGYGTTIHDIIQNYEEWFKNLQQQKQRQQQVTKQIRIFLGNERFDILKQLSDEIRQTFQTSFNADLENNTYSSSTTTTLILQAQMRPYIRSYVKDARNLFEEAMEDIPSEFINFPNIPSNDMESLELLSELASTLPDVQLRELILNEILIEQQKLTNNNNGNERSVLDTITIELHEDDLEEKFVKGSGAGGQKINKTSNRVVLLHKPSGLKVECQQTRSLQQNRKIARKLLKNKLDLFLKGDDSKVSKKQTKLSQTKKRSKQKTKSKLKKQKQDKEEEQNITT